MSRTKRRGILSWKAWVALAASPFALGLLAAIGYGLHEWRAASELSKKIASYEQSGAPYNDASMDAWYRSRTHTEGTQAWLDILSSTHLDSLAWDLPIVGDEAELPPELRADSEWQEADRVEGFLKIMAPVREQILKAIRLPKPVYIPTEFRGFQTLFLQHAESRSVQRLLKLDFEFAYYKREKERAMEDLDTMRGVVEAFDRPGLLVWEFVTIAIYGVYLEAIQRSLTHSQWSDKELEKLMSDLQSPFYHPDRWKDCLHGERSFCLQVSTNDLSGSERTVLTLFPLTPSGRLQVLEGIDQIAGLHQAPLASLAGNARKLEENIRTRQRGLSLNGAAVYMGLFFPAIEAMASAFVRVEDTRQWTRTGVALRLYQLRKGSWPSSLLDLKEVGLSPADVQQVEGRLFEYHVSEEVAELWITDPRNTDPNKKPNQHMQYLLLR